MIIGTLCICARCDAAVEYSRAPLREHELADLRCDCGGPMEILEPEAASALRTVSAQISDLLGGRQ